MFTEITSTSLIEIQASMGSPLTVAKPTVIGCRRFGERCAINVRHLNSGNLASRQAGCPQQIAAPEETLSNVEVYKSPSQLNTHVQGIAIVALLECSFLVFLGRVIALMPAKRLGTYLAFLVPLIGTISIAQDDRISELYSQAQSAESAGQSALAIDKYREILRLEPNLAAAYNNLGRLYYHAIHALSHVCELNAKLAPPRALLGFAYCQMGDYKASGLELEVASKLNPSELPNGGRLRLITTRFFASYSL
jgi:tetratricopeptide (TPR) repeat protein